MLIALRPLGTFQANSKLTLQVPSPFLDLKIVQGATWYEINDIPTFKNLFATRIFLKSVFAA